MSRNFLLGEGSLEKDGDIAFEEPKGQKFLVKEEGLYQIKLLRYAPFPCQIIEIDVCVTVYVTATCLLTPLAISLSTENHFSSS